MEFTIVDSRIKSGAKESIILTYITEDEEKAIDAGKTIQIIRRNKSFSVSTDNSYAYGPIDFSPDSEDLDTLSDLQLLNYKILRGVKVPANFNYDTNMLKLKDGVIKYYDTFDLAKVCQYHHAILGRPERCLLFAVKYYGKYKSSEDI